MLLAIILLAANVTARKRLVNPVLTPSYQSLSQLNISTSKRENSSHGMHFGGIYSPFSLFEKNDKNLDY